MQDRWWVSGAACAPGGDRAQDPQGRHRLSGASGAAGQQLLMQRAKVGRSGRGPHEPSPREAGRRAGTCSVPEGATGPGPSPLRSSAGSKAGGKAGQVCILVGGGFLETGRWSAGHRVRSLQSFRLPPVPPALWFPRSWLTASLLLFLRAADGSLGLPWPTTPSWELPHLTSQLPHGFLPPCNARARFRGFREPHHLLKARPAV